MYRQLGIGTAIDSNVPQAVGALTDWTLVETTIYSSIAVRNGLLYGFGSSHYSAVGSGSVPTLFATP